MIQPRSQQFPWLQVHQAAIPDVLLHGNSLHHTFLMFFFLSSDAQIQVRSSNHLHGNLLGRRTDGEAALFSGVACLDALASWCWYVLSLHRAGNLSTERREAWEDRIELSGKENERIHTYYSVQWKVTLNMIRGVRMQDGYDQRNNNTP